ncbi:aminotransferase class I/II-fold pyridoxal phosphate-dependent enzyme [Rathayibacter tanaceti]|uniref:aminotransferase class I/II-fold pyridoxal phosphate-dependent enzyme n=1 Tax=Rathayibacter tanaceti TaxID=1671680 RepID=UPI000834E196|nr:aminotransferase class I/II-fold pyridoxal phosphate-dependent enzyme [Rathayibacter tanaceti]
MVGVPVRGDGIDLDALASSGADLVVVTPSHQYPTGGRLALAERLELVRRASGGRLLVVEDDYDSEFRYVGAPLPALASLDSGGGVAHVGSFSKTVSPWLRIAYLAVPPSSWLHAALVGLDDERDASASGPTQAALAQFMASGAFRRHLTRARRRYAHRRELVRTFADSVPWGGRADSTAGCTSCSRCPRRWTRTPSRLRCSRRVCWSPPCMSTPSRAAPRLRRWCSATGTPETWSSPPPSPSSTAPSVR